MAYTTPTKVVQAANAALRSNSEALAATIDYNDGTAVDPPDGTVFTTQAEIDDFLTANSATAFKHLTAFWRALPASIANDVTITLASGVHRPEPTATVSFELSGLLPAGGTILINGNATYDTLVASQSITGVQVGSNDPYVDVGGTPFAGLDLRGTFAVLSTGQKVLIHDHTDSRLYLVAPLSPDPTGGSVEVGEPSTKLRNSQDDIATQNSQTFKLVWPSDSVFSLQMQDILVDPFGNTANSFAVTNQTKATFRRIIIDQLSMIAAFSKTPNGNCFLASADSYAFVQEGLSIRCVRPATGGADQALFIASGAQVTLYLSYVGGSEDGVDINGGTLSVSGVIFDAVGTVHALKATDSVFRPQPSGTGIRTEFRNCAVPCVVLSRSTLDIAVATNSPLRFANNTGACIVLNEKSTIDAPAATALLDGGGNADVGIQVDSPSNIVKLSSSVNLTGAVADLRIEGIEGSYASIGTVANPLITTGLNSVGKG